MYIDEDTIDAAEFLNTPLETLTTKATIDGITHLFCITFILHAPNFTVQDAQQVLQISASLRFRVRRAEFQRLMHHLAVSLMTTQQIHGNAGGFPVLQLR